MVSPLNLLIFILLLLCSKYFQKIYRYVHKGEVAPHRHLLQHQAYEKTKPSLVDQPDPNWYSILVSLDQISILMGARPFYLNVVRDAVVSPKLVQGSFDMNQ